MHFNFRFKINWLLHACPYGHCHLVHRRHQHLGIDILDRARCVLAVIVSVSQSYR